MWSSYLHGESVANHWTVKRGVKKKKTTKKIRVSSGGTRSREVELVDFFFVFVFFKFSSVQVEAVQPVQKRAVCIRTAGCYGQSGNGGQGTDRGRGSRPVDSHHSHHGKLSSAERLVAHSCGDNWKSRARPQTHAAMLV